MVAQLREVKEKKRAVDAAKPMGSVARMQSEADTARDAARKAKRPPAPPPGADRAPPDDAKAGDDAKMDESA